MTITEAEKRIDYLKRKEEVCSLDKEEMYELLELTSRTYFDIEAKDIAIPLTSISGIALILR